MKNRLLSLFAVFVCFFFACDKANGNNEEPDNGSEGSYAVLPDNQNTGKIQEMYKTWLQTYYITFDEEVAQGTVNPNNVGNNVKNSARIKSTYTGCNGGTCTVSEAIGYGMLLTALMEDWDKFDRLLAYSKAFRVNGTALMMWEIVHFLSGGGGSATDADIDIAAALIIAYQKTNKQDYLNNALEIGADIYKWEVDENTKLILPAMNVEPMGKGHLYNISYFSLPAIKMLANYDKERDWNAVLDANIAYMKKVQDAGAGLWPDWSNASGSVVDPNNGSNTVLTASDGSKVNSWESYYKETPRIPWRIAWYYHWYGDDRAKDMLNKGMSYLRSKGVNDYKDLKDFYKYDGTKEGSGSSVMMRASLCALGMGSSDNKEWLKVCNDWITSDYTASVAQYYSASLRLIYAMLLNGKF